MVKSFLKFAWFCFPCESASSTWVFGRWLRFCRDHLRGWVCSGLGWNLDGQLDETSGGRIW
jgi:hypothetical protein